MPAPRVALISEEPSLREMLVVALQQRGFEVRSASTAPRGLELVRAWKPDAVVFDVVNPSAGIWDLLCRLRSLTPAPVLTLSVPDGEEDGARATAFGEADYLTKPFAVDDLVGWLDLALPGPAVEATRIDPQRPLGS